MASLVNNRVVLATAPNFVHHKSNENRPDYPLVLEVKATKEVTCKVMVAVRKTVMGTFTVSSAVQYADGDRFYKKDSVEVFDFAAAVKSAYGLSRKLYRVTASRALAGMLHDNVCPATEDIDC